MITIASSLERTNAITHKLSLTIILSVTLFVLMVMIIKELLYTSYKYTPFLTVCN